MSDGYTGEIRAFAFNFAPRNWAFCQGQLLSISQNAALFSLLGLMYGGNGQTNFALPDLRDRTPIHIGPGYVQGQAAGEATHQLTVNEIPAHTHTISGRPAASTASPANALWATGTKSAFASTPTSTMGQSALANTGSGQPHDNMPPYLALNYAICLSGIFPSRN
jgi:microcystin-dependent protein